MLLMFYNDICFLKKENAAKSIIITFLNYPLFAVQFEASEALHWG